MIQRNGYDFNSYNHDAGQESKNEFFLEQIGRTGLRCRTVSLQAEAAATPVVIVPDLDVPPGYRPVLVDFILLNEGTSVAGTINTVTVRGRGETPTVLASILGTSLTANAVLFRHSAGVTITTTMAKMEGADAGVGVEMVADVNGTAGQGPITISAFYTFRQ